MEATKNCPECGRALDMHSPEGHCPRTEYLAALRDFVAAANRLHDAWRNSGDDEARGYPEFMPSFDEACGAFGDWLLAEHKAAERKDRRWIVWFHEDGFDDAWLATFGDRDDALDWAEQQQAQTKRKGCIYYVRKEGE